MSVLSFDAAWGGIAWVILDDGRMVARGWRAFPADGRTLARVCGWLDTSLLPRFNGAGVRTVAIETTNVYGAPEDSEGKPQNFLLQYQLEVVKCAQTVAVWCVMMGLPEPVMIAPQSWRAYYKKTIPKPRPKGAAEWKAWSLKTAPLFVPGCLVGCGKKEAEDTADAILLGVSQQ